MFNGIIEELGTVKSVRDIGGGKELTISCELADSLEVDNSLCVNGVCQTVVRQDKNSVSVQVVEETLRKTALGSLKAGSRVNLERSLSLAQRIDGHIVQGHVDTTGVVADVRKEGTNWLVTITFDPEWRDLVVGRGSIAIDGISLTIARETAQDFTVAIIPYTWEHTVISDRKRGDRVNLEFDILGKYVLRFMQNRAGEHTSGYDEGGQTSGTGAGSGFSPGSGQPASSGPRSASNTPKMDFFGMGAGQDKRGGGSGGEGLTEKKLRDSGFTD
ncbi:riboflavin synthase [Balneolales bacterium ANBcel1]|nr:riboflavin synthase [Balneolales bacterium ANBcel1]